MAAVTAVCVRASLEWIGEPFNGFLMGENRIVAPIDLPGWSGRRAGIPYWSQLVSVDGRPVAAAQEALAAARDAGVGVALRYVFRDGGGSTELTIPVMRFGIGDWFGLFANYLVNGLALLAIGFFVAFLRPELVAARALLFFSLCWGISLIVSLADFASFHFRPLLAIAEGFVPASLFYLTLCFPNQRPLAAHRGLLAAIVASSALLAALNLVLYDAAPLAWTWAYRAGVAWVVAVLLLSVQTAWRERRNVAAIEREKLKIVLLGILTAFGLPFLVLWASHLAGSPLPLNTVTAAWWIFPATIAYAIVQRDLFEIDVFLRRAATWVALSTIVFLLYAALLAFTNFAFHGARVTASPWFALLFSLAVLVALRPLHDALQRAVDRLLFRTRFDFAETTRESSQALNDRRSRDDIAAYVAGVVDRTMAPTSCAIYRANSDGFQLIGGNGDGAATAPLRLAADDLTALAEGRILDGARSDGDGEHPGLLLPLRFEDRLEGFLHVGAKNSGAPYGPLDVELLRTVANQTAMALRSAASYERVTELLASLEVRVEERTRELRETRDELRRSHEELQHAYDELTSAHTQLVHAEKMAALGTLVAGVAHEINNPVSFIHSSIDLIADSLAELRDVLERHLAPAESAVDASLARLRAEIDAGQRFANLMENTAICRDGARRAADIVRDLRTFSRPGTEGREPVELHASIEQSLRLLQGDFKGRIEVRRDYGELPPVTCNAGQISQVFLNLLANAAQAISGRGEVIVRSRRRGDRVEVEVADSGPGMDAATAARVFDPFFTTKAPGEGTGLGLSIARSLVQAHGGDIRVDSTPGRGTIFTVSLPIDATDESISDGASDDRRDLPT